LKENVIIGQLIPAGTGMSVYRSIEVENAPGYSDEDDDDLFYPTVARAETEQQPAEVVEMN
jgi:hypothetical protein